MTWPPVPQPPCDPDCSCHEPDPVPPYTPIPRQASCTSPCCAPPEPTARWIAANDPAPVEAPPEPGHECGDGTYCLLCKPVTVAPSMADQIRSGICRIRNATRRTT